MAEIVTLASSSAFQHNILTPPLSLSLSLSLSLAVLPDAGREPCVRNLETMSAILRLHQVNHATTTHQLTYDLALAIILLYIYYRIETYFPSVC